MSPASHQGETFPMSTIAGLPTARPEEIGLFTAGLERITQIFRRDIERKLLPGVVLAVARHGKLGYLESLGVRDPASCKAFTEVDRAVIAMADELNDNAEVSVKTWSVLERFFSPAELVELILVSGFWRMMAGFLKTARIPLDPIDPTVSGWPEGKAP